MQRDRSEWLDQWDGPGMDLGEAFGRTMAHQQFGPAAKALARGMLDLSARDRAIDTLFKDAGRYVVAMGAVYLHVSDVLTLGRLKAICVGSGLLSAGRARALLQSLQHMEFVERTSPPAGGTAARYAPTASFLAVWEVQLRTALQAATLIEPAAGVVLDQFRAPGVLDTFIRIHSEALLAGAADKTSRMPFMRVFMQAKAGNQIVWSLLAASGADFPPTRAGPITISGLSKRFGVSRAHVARVFEEADREGLAKISVDGTVEFQSTAIDQIRFLYAGQILHILNSAARTAREHGLGSG